MGPMVRLTALVLAVSTSAYAQAVYRWADAEGNVHYTDDASTIPKGAAIVATEGEPISEMGAPPLVKKPDPVVAQRDSRPAATSTDPAIPSNSELYWRGQFQGAREKIHRIEDEIATDRRKVENNGLPILHQYSCYPGYGNGVVVNNGTSYPVNSATPYGNCIQTINPEYQRAKDRIELNRRALERAKEELADLERKASFQAVPNEWRR